MKSAAEALRAWCDASGGRPIEIGAYEPLSFVARPWPEEELIALESECGLRLPEAFRAFALSLGAASLFVNRHGLGIEFYAPPEIRSASVEVWEGEVEAADPRRRSLLLVGDARGLGDYFGWALEVPFPRNFDVFCHEYPPTEYVATSNEVRTWRTFDDWLEHLVQTKGEAL